MAEGEARDRSQEYLAFTLDDLKKLQDLMECPKCGRVMQSPIYICMDGHNVCSRCVTKDRKKCQSCKSEVTDSLNLFAESVSKILPARCQNWRSGCEEQMNIQQVSAHENICPYRKLVECEVADSEDNSQQCCWKGTTLELLCHLRTAHGPTRASSNDTHANDASRDV
ncbi:uncharacterized protein [Periplaneta americana]|uniref:uncharacterized protein n=1 Tax=Periplaneta americana TaxID=6978 RepID=UPI0037E8731A